MNRAWIRGLAGTAIAAMVALQATPLDAAVAPPVSASVSATVLIRAELSLIKDINSVSTSAGTITFSTYDDKDVVGGSPIHMYAPLRSLTGKNWHVASIVANGTTSTLTADVTGTQLINNMDLYLGGFFRTDNTSAGGASTDWELANTFSRTITGPFAGTAPFNYRLRLLTVPASAVSYTGQITFSLTST